MKRKINEVKQQMKNATGATQRLAALEQRLAALEQQKVLLMPNEAGACCCLQHIQLFSMQRQKAAAACFSVSSASAVSAAWDMPHLPATCMVLCCHAHVVLLAAAVPAPCPVCPHPFQYLTDPARLLPLSLSACPACCAVPNCGPVFPCMRVLPCTMTRRRHPISAVERPGCCCGAPVGAAGEAAVHLAMVPLGVVDSCGASLQQQLLSLRIACKAARMYAAARRWLRKQHSVACFGMSPSLAPAVAAQH